MIDFNSAYSQLQRSECEFVDGFVRSLEIEAERRYEPLGHSLARVAATLDIDSLDERRRDLFVKPLVQAAIRERVDALAADRDITGERIVREHAAMAFSNMRNYVDIGEDGYPTVTDMSRVSRVDWSAVQQFEVEETSGHRGMTRKIKIKLYDKQRSLDMLAKYTGLDKPDNDEYAAYKLLPPELVKVPSTATTEAIADQYARFIDG